MHFIEVNDLHKTYDLGTSKVNALRGVTFSVNEGECVFLGGPSGSGKSTLLHIIGCLDFFDRGSVCISQQDVMAVNDNKISDFRAKHIGFVFQNFNLLPVLTAAENVEYPLIINGEKKTKNRRKRVNDMLEAVGLSPHAKHYPNELSGGQRQRVAIARALVHDPKLLIADEPTANLDSVTGNSIVDLMLALSQQKGSTVIICTHNPEILNKAKRKIELRDGLITADVNDLECT